MTTTYPDRSTRTPALLLLLVLVAFGLAAPVAAQPDLTDAPAGRRPLPELPLDGADPAVRAQLAEIRAALEQLLATPDASATERAALYGRYGQLCLLYGFEAAADAAFDNAARQSPGDFRWPYYRGVLAQRAGAVEEARRRFHRAHELGSGYPPLLLRLAETAAAAGNLETAAARYGEALAVAELAPAAYAGLGRLALSRDDFATAIEQLEAALALQPEAAALYHPLALAHRLAGDTERAAELLERRGDRRVSYPDPLLDDLEQLAAGASYEAFFAARAAARGDDEEAERRYRRALAADPDHAVARQALAMILARNGRVEEAIGELRLVIDARPGNARARLQLGMALASRGDAEGALEHLAEAVAAAPDLADARVGLASVLVTAGQPADAVEHFRKAIELAPDNPTAHLGLAEALAASGRRDEAAALYADLVARRPAAEEPRLQAATNLILAGRQAAAAALLEQGLAATAGATSLRHALARLLATTPDDAVRDGGRALRLAEEVMRSEPTPLHAETLAMAYAETGRFADAIALQRRLVDAAREAGLAGITARLERHLAAYERGEPARAPWLAGGP